MEVIEKLMRENKEIKKEKQDTDIRTPRGIYDEMLRDRDALTQKERTDTVSSALALLYDDDGLLRDEGGFCEKFYNAIQNMIREECGAMRPEKDGERMYARCGAVKKHTFSEFKELRSKKLVVSMTSYPERIAFAEKTVESILRQTKKADEVVLWLAGAQFPQKEKDLPEKLLEFAKKEKLHIRWVEDLKPHKKYFYAFLEYPDVLLVTVDDDVYYPADTLERLFESFMMWPNAVSAGRVRCMAADESGSLLPYRLWPNNPDAFILKPSNAFFAVGIGGVLYPTKLFAESPFLDAEAVKETCLYADDIWLKAMEVLKEIPVVQAHRRKKLKNIEGSQDSALYRTNLNKDANDIYLEKVEKWLYDHTDFTGWQTGSARELLLCEESIISAKDLLRAKEKQDLEKECQALEKQCSLLERRHEKLAEQTERKNRKIEGLKSKNEDLNEKLKNTRNKNEGLRIKLENTRNKNKDLRIKLENTRNSRKELVKTNKELVQENAGIKRENEELRRKLEDLRHPVRSAVGKIAKKLRKTMKK